MTVDRVCEWCSGPMPQGKRAGAKYCSPEHKNRAGAKRQRSRLTSDDWRRYNAARKNKREKKGRVRSWEPGQPDRRCAECGETKPIAEFTWVKRLQAPASYCKPCNANRAARANRRKRGLPEDADLQALRGFPAGSTYKTRAGYIMEKAPGHHRADRYGWTYQHILVAERKYGFEITRSFTVHHRNADRSDNRPENLELRTGQHGKGGDALAVLLHSGEGQRQAAALLRSYGWQVEEPRAGGSSIPGSATSREAA